MPEDRPPTDDAAFDRMFTASLAGMTKIATPDALRIAVQALIDQSGLSESEVATALAGLRDTAADKTG